jgi:hypothetical protein
MTEEEREQLAKFAKFMSKHLIGFAGVYVPLDKDGNPGDEKFFSYTGTVLSVKGDWWLVTAGHVFDEIESMLRKRQIQIRSMVLADTFANDAFVDPIPFDFMAATKVWKNEGGFDFAAIPISQYYRSLLTKAGTGVFTEEAWQVEPDVQFYSYRLLGMPDYLVKQNRVASSEPLTGFVKPVLLAIDREPDDMASNPPRLSWKVGPGIQSVVGMSGGAIIGLAMHKGAHIYRLLAIQSSWDSSSRIGFGCPVSTFVPEVERMLKS